MTGSSDRNRARGRPASGFWCQFCRATASEHSGSIITSGNYAGNSVYIYCIRLISGLVDERGNRSRSHYINDCCRVTQLKPQLGNVETRSMESTPHCSGLEGREESREELEAQPTWRSPTPRIAS